MHAMKSEVWIVGLDLAWKPQNASGWVVLVWTPNVRVLDLFQASWLKNHHEVCQAIQALPELSRTVFAVDAPLVRRPFSGFRPLDRLLLKVLRPYRVGVLPPKSIQIASVLDLFRALDVPLYPWPPSQIPGVLEVYPQWVSVGLRRQPLLYKKRRLRPKERIRHLWGIRQSVGAILETRFVLGPSLKQWLNDRALRIPKRRLTDETDALFCALVPLWLHAGYPVRTIPDPPRKGRPYILSLWEDHL